MLSVISKLSAHVSEVMRASLRGLLWYKAKLHQICTRRVLDQCVHRLGLLICRSTGLQQKPCEAYTKGKRGPEDSEGD